MNVVLYERCNILDFGQVAGVKRERILNQIIIMEFYSLNVGMSGNYLFIHLGKLFRMFWELWLMYIAFIVSHFILCALDMLSPLIFTMNACGGNTHYLHLMIKNLHTRGIKCCI